MSASSRGSKRENDYKALREREGEVVYRSAGSKGHADLIRMWRDRQLTNISTRVVLVQVKTDRDNPWQHFGPKAREALLQEAMSVGAEAELVWWPAVGKGKVSKMRVFPSSEWPI